MFLAAYSVIKYPYHVADIVLNIFPFRCVPLIEVDQPQFKTEAITLNDDIFRMKITMIFVQTVDLFKTCSQGMEQVETRKRMKPAARLPL